MTFDEYQYAAIQTAIYPASAAITYPALGLVNEAGEVAGKVKKRIRDDGQHLTNERRREIIDELGDVLWYAAALARDLGIRLEDVARLNLDKLKDRQERGVLGGSGDKR